MVSAVHTYTYDDAIMAAADGLPDRSAFSFETGERGQAAQQLAHYLILSRVPGLNVSREISDAAKRLTASYGGPGFDELGAQDRAAVAASVENRFGPAASSDRRTYTISDIRARGPEYPETENGPFSSEMIEKALLKRVPGLDFSRTPRGGYMQQDAAQETEAALSAVLGNSAEVAPW